MSSLKAWLSVLLALGVTITPLSLPVTAVANQIKQPSVVQRLIAIFRPIPRRSGTRGNGLLMPGVKIWSDRPLFMWDGNVSKIEVLRANDLGSAWSQVLPSISKTMIYQGEPLKPGQTYTVILYDFEGMPTSGDDFILIGGTERQQIQRGLTDIEKRLPHTNRATAEEIAMEKAIYFFEQHLDSDAHQVISSVPNLSADLRQSLPVATQKMPEEPEEPNAAITP